MQQSLLAEAKEKAIKLGLLKNPTYPDLVLEANSRLTEYLTQNKCPILSELLLTHYKHPTNMSAADSAKVLMNHANEPKWHNLPIDDDYGQNLYLCTRVKQDIWNTMAVEFANVFRFDIFFIPIRNQPKGFEIITYNIDIRMYHHFHLDLPRNFAVDIISRDPRILSDNQTTKEQK